MNQVDLAPSNNPDKCLNKAFWSGKAVLKRMVPCLIAAGVSTFQRSTVKPRAYGRLVGCLMEEACFSLSLFFDRILLHSRKGLSVDFLENLVCTCA